MRTLALAAILLVPLAAAAQGGPGDGVPQARTQAVPLLLSLPAEVDPWGPLGPSPYYPADGLQSPLRDSGIHLGGDMWIDTGYESSDRELTGEPDEQFWLQQGRFMLDVTATSNRGRFFAQAKGQVLAHVEEIPGSEHIDTDDAWIRFGAWEAWGWSGTRWRTSGPSTGRRSTR
jgi:hypothetical protein